VIAGERDYRVPYTQSLEFFQCAAAQGVPVEACGFPGRGALGAEAAEQPVLVQDVFGLAGDVYEINRSSRACQPPAVVNLREARQRKNWLHSAEQYYSAVTSSLL